MLAFLGFIAIAAGVGVLFDAVSPLLVFAVILAALAWPLVWLVVRPSGVEL